VKSDSKSCKTDGLLKSLVTQLVTPFDTKEKKRLLGATRSSLTCLL